MKNEHQHLEQELKRNVSGEVRFDKYSRVLYSTDASIYQIIPIGVVIPRNKEDVIATIELASKSNVAVLPRGGGTSLSGQTVGHAVVIDFSKYMNQVVEINSEEKWVRTQPGITLDNLNSKTKSYGLQFAPDPTTSSRGNIGGALGNNSCGAHSVIFGKTVDHVIDLEVVLSNGDLVNFGPGSTSAFLSNIGDGFAGKIYDSVLQIANANKMEIEKQFPKIQRRVSGYNLEELLLGDDVNISKLLVGSEGTLAATTEAKVRLVTLPKVKGLAVIHFNDLIESMEATVEVLKEKPSAIEMMDHLILDMTRQSIGFSNRLTFLEGNPSALLLVEFFGDSLEEVEAKLDRLEKRMIRGKLGYFFRRLMSPKDQANVWDVRKAGLGLLMGIKGDTKPLPFVEDTAVEPQLLPEYVRRFDQIVKDHNTYAGYYGHASVGCLHIRPLVNLKLQDGLDKMISISEQISDLVLEFGGSLSGEHGDGIVRGVWNEKMFGSQLYNAFRDVKKAFDPKGIMNPGKIIDCPPMTENLRYGPQSKVLQLDTTLDFSVDQGFSRAIEMCTGIGSCRKHTGGTMCPSYMATLEEKHSTRGRANALRAVMSGLLPMKEIYSKQMYEIMDLCLECKACKSECPSNVDMTKIKSEFLHKYQQENGLMLRSRIFGNIASFNALGSFFAPLSNWTVNIKPIKYVLDRYLGLDRRRALPPFASQNFSQWFRAQGDEFNKVINGEVILFHDTFTNYNYPQVGIAATKLLQKLGYKVQLANVKCCGRPFISKGMLDKAVSHARHNVNVLYECVKNGKSIIGLEPSCILTFRDDYLDLLTKEQKNKALVVAEKTFLLEEFIQDQSAAGLIDIQFNHTPRNILLHGHCHQKAIAGRSSAIEVLNKVPGFTVKLIDAGCCGMAGSFGFEKEHYEISMKIGNQRLFPAIRDENGDFDVVASGVSCRQQIKQGTKKTSKHLAEILLEAI